MKVTRHLACVMGLGIVSGAGLFAQSIIEYGHGVGRAGAAGAASGTGIAGIFSKVRDTADDDSGKKRQASTAQSPKKAEQVDRGSETDEPSNAPLKMKTSSGVVVAGVSPSWMGSSYREPFRKPVRVNAVEWSNPAEEAAAVAQEVSTEPNASAQVAENESTGQAASAVSGVAAHVVPRDHTDGEVDTSASFSDDVATPPQLEPVTDAEIAGVRIGSKMDEVIGSLGRPTFSLTGIVGKSYTEKYVFKNATGESITVLAWAGVVTRVLVS